ncbi:MAG: DUF3786 domain-containing protein [Deltaproteobacteria bacterium]|nr:DUF3786 domain-containing protein [Deltaproteobacteria bacterium]
MDDYEKAVELGRQALSERDPHGIADQSGANIERTADGGHCLSLRFLEKSVLIDWPGFEMRLQGSDETLSLQQQVLILHYLDGAGDTPMTGEWVAYQEIPDGRFYLDAFLRRAKNPMIQVFGENPELLVQLATTAYGAKSLDQGDFAVTVQALPKVPVALILWRGDDEFPPEGTLLFDRSIARILSAEDVAWLAGMIIYPLIGMAKAER